MAKDHVNEPHIACSCGQVVIELKGVSDRTGTHAVCYCVDCQAFARALGKPAMLDEHGGTDLFQARPHQMKLVQGREHLAVLQLKRKGLYRWYASCCDTPLLNTPGSPKIAIASFLVDNVKGDISALGPVRFRYKQDQALTTVTERSDAAWKFALRAIGSILSQRLSGKWKQTPFFDLQTGRGIERPRVLSEDDRRAAYKVQ